MSPFQLILTLAVLVLPFTVDVASAQSPSLVSVIRCRLRLDRLHRRRCNQAMPLENR